MLSNSVVNISQYICVSNHHVVNLKHTRCGMSIFISIKLDRKKRREGGRKGREKEEKRKEGVKDLPHDIVIVFNNIYSYENEGYF